MIRIIRHLSKKIPSQKKRFLGTTTKKLQKSGNSWLVPVFPTCVVERDSFSRFELSLRGVCGVIDWKEEKREKKVGEVEENKLRSKEKSPPTGTATKQKRSEEFEKKKSPSPNLPKMEETKKPIPSANDEVKENPNPPKIEQSKLKFMDIGINLTDSIYNGSYHGTKRHEDDLEDVISRAKEVGCVRLLVTGSDLVESRKGVELARRFPGFIYSTIGVHPCSCSQFETYEGGPEKYLEDLKRLAVEAKEGGWCVAFGEFGLDYDRLEHCPAPLQRTYFTSQLHLATQLSLPLFLHSRAAHADFRSILSPFLSSLPKRGVVHSFTGTKQEMAELVDDGWSIGINGCSLKTEENCEVVKDVPLDRLMLETDGPWCEIRPSHYSSKYLKEATKPEISENLLKNWPSVKKEKFKKGAMVKGRNEPCMIGKVAVVVAGIKGIGVEEVVRIAWENSVRMFGV